MALPTRKDVDDFIEDVDEVARLIEGLQAGTLPPDYVDRRIAERNAAAAGAEGSNNTKPSRALAPKSAPPLADAAARRDTGDGAAAAAAALDDDGEAARRRRAELLLKVETLKANRARKLRARAKYDAYVAAAAAAAAAGGGGGASSGGGACDYARWDLWCPSDDEDALFDGLAPDTPAFRAMERDIDERHRRLVEQRQIAERQRVAGNAAMAARQWSEALRCYEIGLDAQRHNLALHANAALAALKLGCYVQALEHCDKVLHIAGAPHKRPRDPLCAKALQRRAAAHAALGQPARAVRDLEAALDLLGGRDAEVEAALARARALAGDAARRRRIDKAMEAGSGAAAAPFDVKRLRAVERLVGCLRASGTGGSAAGSSSNSSDKDASVTAAEPATAAAGAATAATAAAAAPQQQDVAQACKELSAAVLSDEHSSTYFRTCGGLAAASAQLIARCPLGASRGAPTLPPRARPGSSQPSISGARQLSAGAQAALLQLLEAACRSNSLALEDVAGDAKLLAAATQLVVCSTGSSSSSSSSSSSATRAAAVRLLLLLAQNGPRAARKAVAAALSANQAAGFAALLAVLEPHASAGSNDLYAAEQAAALDLCATCLPACKAPGEGVAEMVESARGARLFAALVAAAEGRRPRGAEAVQERALAVLTCMAAASARLRRILVGRGVPPTAARLACELQRGLCGGAAAALLLNLSADAQAAALVASSASRVASLLDAVCIHGPVLASTARITAALARIMAQAAGAKPTLAALAATERVVDALTRAQQAAATATGGAAAVAGGGSDLCGVTPDAAAAWRDGAVRLLAVLLSAGAGSSGSADAAAAPPLARSTGEAAIRALARECRGGGPGHAAGTAGGGGSEPCVGSTSATAGNAALALGHLAADPSWHEAMLDAGAVDALIAVARAGRGDAASRNAGIALARAAAGSARIKDRLREMRVTEALVQYVKP